MSAVAFYNQGVAFYFEQAVEVPEVPNSQQGETSVLPDGRENGGTFSQEGDVLLCQTNNGGEVNIESGLMEMSSGLFTAVYLSLFGGNETDDGTQGSLQSWWGNVQEIIEQQYRSRTQYLLKSLPAVPVNLLKIQDAVQDDLAWMLTSRLASEVNVTASMPGLNKISIQIQIEAFGDEANFEFTENWKNL